MSVQIENMSYARRLPITTFAFAFLLSVVDVARSETQGEIGALSLGKTEILLIIVEPARFLAPAGFFSSDAAIPKFREAMSASADRSGAIGLRGGNSQGFNPQNRQATDWLANELVANGEAEFSVCIPRGQGDVGLLNSSQQSTKGGEISNVGGGSLVVKFSKSSGNSAASGSKGCPDGLKTNISISMSPGAPGDFGAGKLESPVPQNLVNDSTQISLIIVPR